MPAVPLTIITFVHKDTKETHSIAAVKDIYAMEIRDTIFDNMFLAIRLSRVIKRLQEQGHTVYKKQMQLEFELPINN